MKKLLLIALAAFAVLATCSCAENHCDEPVAFDSLPPAARSFIESYFVGYKTTRIESDGKHHKKTYEVWFADGTKAEFDHIGSWTDIDAPFGKSVPRGVVPRPILDFVHDIYPAEYVNEISRDDDGYEVELGNDVELEFDVNGMFVKIDR